MKDVKRPYELFVDELHLTLNDGIPEPNAGSDTYVFVDENGFELVGLLTEGKVTLSADPATDIRVGTTAITDAGVVTGAKEIPAYYVYQGHRVITNGSEFAIRADGYTKLQAMLCKFNTNLDNSVSTDKVAINDSVYEVNSTAAISSIVVNTGVGQIEFGLTNTSGSMYLIRYFMYKEVY